jgi:hypothetical protein
VRVLILVLAAGPILFAIAVAFGYLEVRITEEPRSESNAVAAKAPPTPRFLRLGETEAIVHSLQSGMNAWAYQYSGGMVLCWAEIKTGGQTRILGPLPGKEVWKQTLNFEKLQPDADSAGSLSLTLPENGKAGKYHLTVSWNNFRGSTLTDEATLELPALIGAGPGQTPDSSSKMRGGFTRGKEDVIRRYQVPSKGITLQKQGAQGKSQPSGRGARGPQGDTLVALKVKFLSQEDLDELRK